MKRAIRLVALLLLCLVMSNCAQISSHQPADSTLDKASHCRRNENLTAWQLSGIVIVHDRLVSTKPGMAASSQTSLHFVWDYHDSQHYTLLLTAFLNLRTLKIVKDAHGLTLYDSQTGTSHHPNEKALSQSVLKVALPIDELTRWLRALSSSSVLTSQMNGLGCPYQHFSRDWQVHYDTYQNIQGYWLPKTCRVDNKNHQVTLTQLQWRL